MNAASAFFPAESGKENSARVCVLIPVWRDQEGLAHSLDVLAEDPYPFDIVVVDDGSPTPIICPELCGIHPVTLLRLARNQGIEHALNHGLGLILERGYDYVARLDCADTPMLGRIARQVEYMDQNPALGILGTWARCIDDDGAYLFTLRYPYRHKEMLRRQRYAPALLHPTVMLRVAALREIGLYSDAYKTAEDYDLFIRMGQRFEMANLPEALTEYVVSAGGTTAAKRRQNLVARARIQMRYFGFADPHAYLGLARTFAFMLIPFDWLVAIKQRVWK